MRLGEQKVNITKDTLASKIYTHNTINERHRHRYEFNNNFLKDFENHGMIFSGISADQQKTIEIIELKNHPFFIGCQYHPEFGCKPRNVDPIFTHFLLASLNKQNKKK